MAHTFRGLLIALIAVVVLGGAGAVQACDGTYQAVGYEAHTPCCYYKTVIVYETRLVPCTETMIRYDDCGCPYKAQVTVYHKVRVAVTKQVKVCE